MQGFRLKPLPVAFGNADIFPFSHKRPNLHSYPLISQSIQRGLNASSMHLILADKFQSTPQTGLVYASGYQLGAKQGGVLVEWLRQLPAAVRVVVDFGPRLDTMSPELINALIRPGVILTLNQREANLLGMNDDIEAFSQQLHEKTQELVVIRCGEKGSYYYGGEQDHSWIAAKKVKMVDSIGAGDSHCAGLLAGLSLGLSHWQSMMLANSVAGYVVSQAGGDCAPTIAQLFENDFL